MSFLTLSRGTSLKYNFFHLKNILQGTSLYGPNQLFTGHQSLFTASSLGIEGFETRRKKCENKFVKSKDNFLKTMKYFCEEKEKDYSIYIDDLKNMIYLCQNNKDDLELLMQMAKKFHIVSKQNRIVDFAFGPEFMRLYYHLNLPHEAKKILHEEELKGLFSQVSSYMIAMTLFYNAGHYQDVVETMEKMVEQRVAIRTFTKSNFVLTMAACYQMNSAASLESALSFIRKFEDVGGKLDPRSLGFAAALALKQGKAKVAFELTYKTNSPYCVLKNIKAEALVALDRPEDALPILRGSAERAPSDAALSGPNDHVFFAQTVDAVERALKEAEKNDALEEFALIKEMLETKKLVTKKTLDGSLCEPINIDQSQRKESSTLSERDLNRQMIAASFNRRKERRPRETQVKIAKGFNNFDDY